MLIGGTENLHREDLTSVERENLIYNLWKLGQETGSIREGHGSLTDLSDKLGMSIEILSGLIKAKELRESMKLKDNISTKTITLTSGLPKTYRKIILKKVEKDEITPSKVREYVSAIKKVSTPIKQAILASGSKITPDIALKIEKNIQTDEGKKQAILEIEKGVYHSLERSIEHVIEDTRVRERKQFGLDEFIEISDEEMEEELFQKKIPITFYTHKNLNGTTKKRVWKVADGSIIEVFSATPDPQNPSDVVCPHFMKSKWSIGCPFECAWCYLQGTLRFLPQKTAPAYKDRKIIEKHTEFFLYYSDPEILNTGELSDSLMDEGGGEPFSTFIINLFKKYRNNKPHKVLFLSKFANVHNLLKIDGQDVAICSFSVNAVPVAERWEKKAAPVRKRLEAAKKLKDAGYEVRLRIDPMVPVKNWDESYSELLDLIFDHLDPDRITLGSLRGLQSTINNARDKSWINFLSEKSNWGLKVPFTTRFKMYEFIINRLNEKWNYSKVALCKETLAMWGKLGLDYTQPACNCIE